MTLKKGHFGPIPRRLQNKHFDGEDNQNKGQFYIYPQDCPNHWVEQQYLPDAIKDRKYYEFGDNKKRAGGKGILAENKGERSCKN